MNNGIFSELRKDESKDRKRILGLVHLALVTGLVGLIIMIMRPFIVPLLWSVILVILLLPLFRFVEFRFGGRRQLAALLVTTGVGLFFVFGVVPLIWRLGNELLLVLKSVEGEGRGISVEWLERVESIPFAGPLLVPYVRDEINGGYSGIMKALKNSNIQWLSFATATLSNIAAVFFGGFISILSLYFLLAHIATLVNQIRNGALALGGPAYLTLLESAYETVRATLRGVLVTALAQGALAGLAYYLAGIQISLLLTILTCLAALLPFGPPFVYVPVAVMMAATGYSWVVIAVFLIWCVGVVSVVDNVLRPYFISQATRLSFLLVLFGIVGGIASFGFVGVFIGPVVITLGMHLWGELAVAE